MLQPRYRGRGLSLPAQHNCSLDEWFGNDSAIRPPDSMTLKTLPAWIPMVWIKDPHQTKPHRFTTPATLTTGEFMTIVNQTGGIYLKWGWLIVKSVFAHWLLCGSCGVQLSSSTLEVEDDERCGGGEDGGGDTLSCLYFNSSQWVPFSKWDIDLLKEIRKPHVGCKHCLHCHNLWFKGWPNHRAILH